MTNNFKIMLTKNLTYFFVVFGLYIIQTTPGLFSLWGVKPLFVLPAALCVAVLEDELQGGILGAFAGLLCDTTSFTPFGYNAIMFLILCIIAAFLVMFAVQPSLSSIVSISAGAILIRNSVEHFFFYFIWGFEGSGTLYFTKIIPNIIWSCLWVPLIYYMIKNIKKRFDKRMEV